MPNQRQKSSFRNTFLQATHFEHPRCTSPLHCNACTCSPAQPRWPTFVLNNTHAADTPPQAAQISACTFAPPYATEVLSVTISDGHPHRIRKVLTPLRHLAHNAGFHFFLRRSAPMCSRCVYARGTRQTLTSMKGTRLVYLQAIRTPEALPTCNSEPLHDCSSSAPCLHLACKNEVPRRSRCRVFCRRMKKCSAHGCQSHRRRCLRASNCKARVQ